MKDFVKERNEALASLDKAKIEAYARKYMVPLQTDETVFWMGVHKAIANSTSQSEEIRERSRQWLKERGYGV